MFTLQFAYPQLFYLFIPLWLIATIYRLKFYKAPIYLYPKTNQIAQTVRYKKNYFKKIVFTLRSLFLFSLIFFIARPQWVDSRSRVNVEGVDIIITLDVSGSMQLFDDLNDRRSRITVAKEEAIHFIKKRTDDPIGIVIFGADAVSSCPLTLDKPILQNIVHNIKLGIINQRGTSLGTGLATAVNKLRNSHAKNKIIILLTDGKPTPETEKVSVSDAISLAKSFDVKIYTIAIGNKKGAYVTSAFGFIEQIPDSVDETLLKSIAHQTNGKFFRANNPQEMKIIYKTINNLEKTKYETNLFSHYYEALTPFIWIALALFVLELILSLFVWRKL